MNKKRTEEWEKFYEKYCEDFFLRNKKEIEQTAKKHNRTTKQVVRDFLQSSFEKEDKKYVDDILDMANQHNVDHLALYTRTLKDREIIDENDKKANDIKRSGNGKYRVIGADDWDGSYWIHGDYDSYEEAIAEAKKENKKLIEIAKEENKKPFGDQYKIFKCYYTYDPDGNFLGGNSELEYFKTLYR